jgi:Cu+-exporting ATPase
MDQHSCCQHHSKNIDPNNKNISSKNAIYSCPMHPQIQQNKPGSCPICGMSLDPTIPISEEDDAKLRSLLKRFWIGLLLTVPIIFLEASHMLLILQNVTLFNVTHFPWIQWILCSPVVLWCGWPFIEKAWNSIVNRSLNMFTLIAMGIGAAYLYSTTAVLFPQFFPDSFKSNGHLNIYFEAAAVITVLVLLGQVLELKAKNRTSQAIKALLDRQAKTAHIIINGQEHDIEVDAIKVGDNLRVKPGEKIPVDGTILEGFSYVDESMISGEAVPVKKSTGSTVIGSTINQNGSFVMTAKHVGSDTILSQIVQMVSEAQRSRAPIQKLADIVASYFVPLVILIAIITSVIWSIFGPEPRYAYALVSAVAVLIIACPCALGLATPMSIMVGIGRGAEIGILIKNAETLEKLEKVNTLVIDKTGTLTEGRPRVTKIVTTTNWNENNFLRIVASLENNSEHPIAKAIVNVSHEKGILLLDPENFNAITGEGVSGVIESKKVFIGKLDFLKNQQVQVVPELIEKAKDYQTKSAFASIIFVGIDHQLIGFIAIEDPIKETTFKAIQDLHKMNIKVIMASGDNLNVANAIAKKLGIDEVYAQITPKDKYDLIQKLKNKGYQVAMAGDGINDAPALAAADVGIAMGNGTDIAIESAGVTLIQGDLNGIVNAISLSKATMRNIRQNLFFAFIYNFAGVPIAAGVLYPFFGILLNPIIASAAMSLSSVSVILNALRLKRSV